MPHLLVGGKAFHGREEVETVRAALAAIEWPDDELSVFATLKGSLFAIDDEQLLEFRHRFGTFHPFRDSEGARRQLRPGARAHRRSRRRTSAPIADALRLLQELHRRRNYRPVADTIHRLIAETRAHVGFILRPAGEQALANVLHVAELARQYEASRRHFVPRLHRRAASGRRIGGRRSADSRRGQRRRPADDGAQGEGARVSDRDPRRPDVPDQPERREPLPRSVAPAVRDENRRLGALRAARARAASKWRATRPKASGWRTLRPRARAICSSCRRSATSRGKAAGSAR